MSKNDLTRCHVCLEDRKSRRREFSPHAWTALTVWGEVESHAQNHAMCDGCYTEFRDLLIDRAAEVEHYLHAQSNGHDLASVREMAAFRSGESHSKAQIAS